MILPLLLAPFAHAETTTLPHWNWPAKKPVRFHIESEMTTPRGERYYARLNTDARAGALKVRGDIECISTPEGKTQVVQCAFHYVEVKGQPITAAEGTKLDTVMKEWTEDFSGTKVEMVLAPDGKMRTFDVKPPVDPRDHREGGKLAQEAMILKRVFCIFDLPITTDDKDWVRGWKAKASQVMELPSLSGSVGAVDIKHTHGVDRDGYTVIETNARGTLSTGAAADAESGSRQVDVRMTGETLFDATTGMIAWRDFSMDGQLMVSAQMAGSSAEYFQTSAVQWILEFPEPGEVPLTLAAQNAPRRAAQPAALAAGVSLVPYADLGMDPLFVQGMPAAAQKFGFPKTKVSARVLVNADGVPSSATGFAGYEALIPATEQALLGAKFPAKGAPYAVDVDVEWRP